MKNKILFVLFLVLAAGVAAGGFLYATRPQGDDAAHENGVAATISLQYAAGEQTAYGVTDSHVAVVTSEAVRLFDKSGEQVQSAEAGLSAPMLDTAGKYVLAAERGGRTVMLLEGTKIAYTVRLESNIVSAKVNASGRALVITKGTLHKNEVYVLDQRGTELFKWNSGGLYVVDGDVSDNNRDIALSTVDANTPSVTAGIYLFNVGESKAFASNMIDGAIVSNVVYSGSTIFAVGDSALYVYNSGGAKTGEVPYDDRPLLNFDVDGSSAVLAFANSEDGVASRGTVLETYNTRGEQTGRAVLDSELKFMDVLDGRVAVNDGADIGVYNLKGAKQFAVDMLRDISDIRLFAGGGYAAAFTSTAVDVVRIK